MKTKLLALVVTAVIAISALFAGHTVLASNGTPVGSLMWGVQFFNNASLSGTPVITRLDQSVGANWGTGSPGLGIPADNFSARWTTTANLKAATYRFTILADDAVRLIIDGKSYIDTFSQPTPGVLLTKDLALSAGSHSVQIDYRENTSTAFLYFTWEQISTPTTPAPAPRPNGPAIGVVNTTGLNVHAGPGYSHNVVVLAFKDWQMTLLGRNRDTTWLKVQTYDGKIGWVEVAHISTTYPLASLAIVDGTQQPSPTKPTQPQPNQPAQYRTHTVQKGETLSVIARQYGVDMMTLARHNSIANINLIYVGQVLRIP